MTFNHWNIFATSKIFIAFRWKKAKIMQYFSDQSQRRQTLEILSKGVLVLINYQNMITWTKSWSLLTSYVTFTKNALQRLTDTKKACLELMPSNSITLGMNTTIMTYKKSVSTTLKILMLPKEKMVCYDHFYISEF